MADENPTDRRTTDPPSPAVKDAQTESAVLAFVLRNHPAQLTADELALALLGGAGEFQEDDAIRRAVRELAGAGLLHRNGALLSPTRAARYFAALEVG